MAIDPTARPSGGSCRANHPSDAVHGPQGLLTFDVVTGKSLPPILVPYGIGGIGFGPATLTAHLDPTGNYIVTEKYEWRALGEANPSDALRKEKFKTGQIDVYDVNSGTLVRRAQLDPAPGFYGHVVGFSPDGQLMYYAATEQIYAVHLTRDEPAKALKGLGASPITLFFSESK